MTVVGIPKDSWDPMQSSDREVGHWTTTNLGEAVPGIITPLGTALWGGAAHRAAWRTAYQVGVISGTELRRPLDPALPVLRMFFGRVSMNLDYIALYGDRMPGVTGPETMVSMFGQPPDGMTFRPTRRRYPFIAARLPAYFVRVSKLLNTMAASVDSWWRREVEEVPRLDQRGAVEVFADSVRRFETAMAVQTGVVLVGVRPLFDLLSRVISRAGTGDITVLSGTGGAEMAVITDIWRASRGQIEIAEVVREHGFHGPAEGEISSRVWRDCDSPLHAIVRHYRELPETESPLAKQELKEHRLRAETEAVLDALPARERPTARAVMRLARERIPQRGVAKRSFLQTLDVARLAARQAGRHLSEEGKLNDPEDVFYLTADELVAGVGRETRALIEKRRARRTEYEALRFRSTEWSGMPQITRGDFEADSGQVIRGTGASPGVVEGRVRVVSDPSFTDVEPDEVLVASTTDPSWCSIMYVSVALVVDLGGMLSHAAVVAREIDIPCVVNTRDGSRRLRTGDLVRVDGGAGTVQVLKRANP